MPWRWSGSISACASMVSKNGPLHLDAMREQHAEVELEIVADLLRGAGGEQRLEFREHREVRFEVFRNVDVAGLVRLDANGDAQHARGERIEAIRLGVEAEGLGLARVS